MKKWTLPYNLNYLILLIISLRLLWCVVWWVFS